MERDFMGLNSRKDSAVVVKEEAVEFKDSGASWMMPNKDSTLPPFQSFKSVHDEKMTKVVPENHTSLGYMAMSSANAFDMKRLPGENCFGGATSKQGFVSGVPVAAPCSIIPSNGFMAGTTEPWFSAKAASGAAQLTIFYGGSVSVFEDITPEKAQAIMFLAGGCVPANMVQTRPLIQSPASKFAAGDAGFMNQNMNAQPSSALSSPISVSSHPVNHSGAVSPNSDEAKAPKTSGMLTNIPTKVEVRMASLGPGAAATIIPSAIPQARKASLARFLEKRKERAMNSSPYNVTKKSAEYSTSEAVGAGLPATPATSSVAGC
ncbi:OLC1v1032950C2 [Oldenlandia corymbosa var. corymbosa]|uniref:Protein TIFY n=1 Tax=Oldenlandia corymbosa var. corymbosa TaxID=529605 RepID=A0AAV1CNL8_OLDCO|nr:OLC1v1032950C2 [Oldenlandia corymbosa var. corymbosa]